MWLEKVVGQEKIKEKLIINIKTGKISHAQLFLGKQGRGGLPLAIGFAQKILITNSKNKDNLILKSNKLIHPDMHFVFPINTTQKVKSNPLTSHFLKQFRIEVIKNPYISLFDWLKAIEIENKQGLINSNQIKESLKELSLKPFESDFKVIIIWMPEKMNTFSANKMLKIIEEPPKKTIFILVSEDEDKILPTIKSRTQIIRIPPIEKSKISTALQHNFNIKEDLANNISAITNGDYQKAISYSLNNEEREEKTIFFILWMRLCFTKDFFKLQDWIKKVTEIGREAQKNILIYGLYVFRECMVNNYVKNNEKILFSDRKEKEFIKKFKPFINTANILQLTETLETAITDIERNAYSKTLFFDVSLKVMKLLTIK